MRKARKNWKWWFQGLVCSDMKVPPPPTGRWLLGRIDEGARCADILAKGGSSHDRRGHFSSHSLSYMGQSDLAFVQIVWPEDINILCIANADSLLITVFILSCNCSEKKLLACHCVVSSTLNKSLAEDLVMDRCR
jgi:hypothetical protein